MQGEHGMQPHILSERELIAEILAGNPERYYELIAPLERRIYFTAFEILRVEADAEDVAQEAILKAFRSLASFKGEARFSTWLFSITINEARMRLRKRREVSLDSPAEDGSGSDEDYTPITLADWRELPLDTVLNKEMAAHLEQATASLPLSYREVLVLRDIDGISTAEAATALGISEGNVKVRLLRARLMLRDYFVSHCLLPKSAPAGRGRR
jgi:RNA polymerase sigma-70 factor (ECF subfamily)